MQSSIEYFPTNNDWEISLNFKIFQREKQVDKHLYVDFENNMEILMNFELGLGHPGSGGFNVLSQHEFGSRFIYLFP